MGSGGAEPPPATLDGKERSGATAPCAPAAFPSPKGMLLSLIGAAAEEAGTLAESG